MIDLDAVQKQAQEDLLLTCPQGRTHPMLWDHSLRVFKSARLVARFPEVDNRSVDDDVLSIVSLYHDSGWAVQHRDREVAIDEVLDDITSSIQRTVGASFMVNQLAGLVNKSTLEHAAECIRVLSDHDIAPIEAQIVAEANHLDEFHVFSTCSKVCRQLLNGKSIDSVIETWDNQMLYGYWSAKIKDSFRFGNVREIASARLQILEGHIQNIKRHNGNEDLLEFLNGD